ncbi:MAG: transcription elongation factor GreA [Clostridia bacterium]
MPDKKTLLTYEGLIELEKELEFLKSKKRMEIAERIKTAISFGDISENSEYDEAKNEQGQVEARIMKLEQTLRNVEIIDDKDLDTKQVRIGSVVRILDIEYDEEEEYKIVGSTEADPTRHRISDESPIGSVLLGKKKGQKVQAHTPSGIVELKILSIGK